jgi:glycerophosphoryl diester phosphodiesterase
VRGFERRLVRNRHDLVAEARDQGLKLATWTVNDPAEMVRLAGFGLDAIYTGCPDLLMVPLTS